MIIKKIEPVDWEALARWTRPRENRCGIRRRAAHLRSRTARGFHILCSKRQGEALGYFPTRQRSDRCHTERRRLPRRGVPRGSAVAHGNGHNGHRLQSLPDREAADAAHASREARDLGIFCRAFAFTQCPIRSGSGGSAFQFERKASGADPLAARSFWQGKQSRTRASRESARIAWHKWSAQPGRGSVIS